MGICAGLSFNQGRNAAAGLALAAVVAGCGTSIPTQRDEQLTVYETMGSAMRQCTINTGYNPELANTIPQNQLGEGEEDWRDCVYDALDRVVAPNLANPDALDDIVDTDELMTEGILDGTTTRAARTQAILARVTNIQLQERVVREQQVQGLGAGALMAATTNNSDYDRARSDLDALARNF